jgi:hypothetical protein
MASIVPGYEYDIFISYRQKDNKDRGVEKAKGRVGDQEEISSI